MKLLGPSNTVNFSTSSKDIVRGQRSGVENHAVISLETLRLLPLLASVALLSSCFELFETIAVDSGWRHKYSFYVQSDVPDVIERFDRVLKDHALSGTRGQRRNIVSLAHDGSWMESSELNAAGFKSTWQPGKGQRGHHLVLSRNWTHETANKYVSSEDIQVLASQSRKPGTYKLTVELPGRLRSAKLVKNGRQSFPAKGMKGGRAYWMIPDFQLTGMTSMDIDVVFDGKMVAMAAAPAPRGCSQSPESLGRMARILTELGRTQSDAGMAATQKQSKYESLLKDVESLYTHCGQDPLSAPLGEVKAWLTSQKPAPPPAAPAATQPPPAAKTPPPAQQKPKAKEEEAEEPEEEEESEDEEEEEE